LTPRPAAPAQRAASRRAGGVGLAGSRDPGVGDRRAGGVLDHAGDRAALGLDHQADVGALSGHHLDHHALLVVVGRAGRPQLVGPAAAGGDPALAGLDAAQDEAAVVAGAGVRAAPPPGAGGLDPGAAHRRALGVDHDPRDLAARRQRHVIDGLARADLDHRRRRQRAMVVGIDGQLVAAGEQLIDHVAAVGPALRHRPDRPGPRRAAGRAREELDAAERFAAGGAHGAA
jgi:hypothetical protein